MIDGKTKTPMSLFSRKSKAEKAPPRGALGKRLYAIGDVHGRFDLMQDLLKTIESHNAARPHRETFVAFLGDLIDRGPQSRDVVAYLKDWSPDWAKPVFLMGNHEECFVRCLTGEASLIEQWLSYGGYACAESYGVPRAELLNRDAHDREHMLKSAVPQSHIEFLCGFAESARFGDYFLVHAGVRPGHKLDAQSGRDMRWIRDDFLKYDKPFGPIIVHGHSVTDRVDERPNRIGLDTGAHASGLLSALWIEDDVRGILDVQGTLGDEADRWLEAPG